MLNQYPHKRWTLMWGTAGLLCVLHDGFRGPHAVVLHADREGFLDFTEKLFFVRGGEGGGHSFGGVAAGAQFYEILAATAAGINELKYAIGAKVRELREVRRLRKAAAKSPSV